MLENEEFRNMMYIPFSIIVASFITIIITSKVVDANGLSGLIGGYSGLLSGLFFIIILIPLYDPVMRNSNIQSTELSPTSLQKTLNSFYAALSFMKEIFPILLILSIITLLLYYLFTYFDKIASGEISSYYNSFLTLSTVLLAFQIIAISNAIYEKSKNMSTPLFTRTNYSLLVMFGMVNTLAVITLGIILRHYSTQG